MSFKFACPHCGQRIGAADEDIGTVGGCPSCGREFLVPSREPAVHTFLTPREPIQAPPWQEVVRLKGEEGAVVRPRRSLSIFALMLSLFPVLNVAGFVLGIIAVVRSDKEGRQGARGLAACAMVLCGVLLVPVNVAGYLAAGPVLRLHLPGTVEFKPAQEVPDFVSSGETPRLAAPSLLPKPAAGPIAPSRIVESKPAAGNAPANNAPGDFRGAGTQKAAVPPASAPTAPGPQK